jgi:hypothetical protein
MTSAVAEPPSAVSLRTIETLKGGCRGTSNERDGG